MKLSKLFTKTKKEVSKDETSANAIFLTRGGFIDKEMAGVYTFLPLGLKVLRKIENIIREEMNRIGGQEVLMPTLTSIEKYKRTNRDKLDVLFKTKSSSGSEYVLNQSHEEVVTPLVQQFARSYKDLPVYVYQIQNKFRNEPRAKSGLLRGREFSMKDLYSFHKDEQDLDNYYAKVKKAYFKIFKRLGLGKRTFLTFAAGGTFSKYSHEFQTLCDTGEDNIYLCNSCKIGVNKEIISQQSTCPQCGSKKLVEKKAIEVGNIFKLKEKFSKAFGYTYIDDRGKAKPIIMGCYGIGPSRVMGTIVEVYHDKDGIIWPRPVSPFQVQLIEIKNPRPRPSSAEGGQKSKIKNSAKEIYQELQRRGIEVLYDDREDVSIGEKFADADLIGIPIRMVISKKTLVKNGVEFKKRGQKTTRLVKIKDIVKLLK